MALTEYVLDNGIKVYISKRRGSKNIKLSIDSTTGKVKISQPNWLPYTTGLQFAQSKQNWIKDQLPSEIYFQNGQLIGKNHRLEFIESIVSKRTKITDTQLIIYVNPNHTEHDINVYVKKEVERASLKILRQESDILLPQRVNYFSEKAQLTYNELNFKKLKSRWGSCDLHKNITLNIYLIQLPWRLIDYVILHELAHTKYLHHQKDFWNEILKYMPDAKLRRKEMKQYKPQVIGS